MRIPETRFTWPVQINLCKYWLWNGTPGGGCTHGRASQHWPWWKLGAVTMVRPGFDPKSPCIGRRVWVYYRFGCFHVDVVVDRRNLGITRKTLGFRFRSWLAGQIAPGLT